MILIVVILTGIESLGIKENDEASTLVLGRVGWSSCRVMLYLVYIRRTLDMNGIYSTQLNESNLTSLGCLIGRKSHQPHRYNLHKAFFAHVPLRRLKFVNFKIHHERLSRGLEKFALLPSSALQPNFPNSFFNFLAQISNTSQSTLCFSFI